VHFVLNATDGLHFNATICLHQLSTGVAIRPVFELQDGVARPRDVIELAMPTLRDDDAITLVRI
jgi:hypothetical protein